MVTKKQMESLIAFISPPQVNLLARQKRSVAPNQKRDCKSKSRTGCITCRTRRVKCDERRPSCLRCEKAEFDCEGYALPVKLVDGDAVWQLGKGPRRLVAPNANPQWAPLDETEVGYFDLFRHQLIVDLAGHNQEDFWSRVVLCESARDESVRQSIVALGALSQALFFMPQPTGIVPSATRPLSSQEVLNHHHKAAIHHHTRAIKLFRKRIRPENAVRSARSTMVMTLLLVTFEFLQGNMKAADHLMIGGIQLLRNDLRLLREAAGLLRTKRDDDELEDIEHMLPKLSVASSVTHFCDLQSLQFAVLRSDGLGDLPDADCQTSLPKLLALWSDFSTRVLVFTCQAFRHQLLRIEHDTAGTEARQTQLLVRLRRWRTVLDQYRAAAADNEAIQSAIRMLMPHWLMLYVFNSCVLDPTDLLYDQFEPEFREINARCAEILSMTATDGTAEPLRNKIHFSLGDGLIMPLAVVIGKCRDHDVRMEAAEMFRLLPREAAWDAQALTIGKLGLVLLEERARAIHGYIPSASRWFWTGGEWDIGNRALHSRYLRIVPAEDGSPITVAMTMDLDSLPNICVEVGCTKDHSFRPTKRFFS